MPTYPFYKELNDIENVKFEKNIVKKITTYCDYIFTPSSIRKIFGKSVTLSKLIKFYKTL